MTKKQRAHAIIELLKEEYPDAELTMKLHEAEEAVKNEKAWLSLDELKNQVEQ